MEWTEEELEQTEKLMEYLSEGDKVRAMGIMLIMSNETREKLKEKVKEWKKEGLIGNERR